MRNRSLFGLDCHFATRLAKTAILILVGISNSFPAHTLALAKAPTPAAITTKSTPTNCNIIETKNILDVAKYANKRSLIIFDLDNTIIEPQQLIGSDQWFEAHYHNLKQKTNDQHQALQDAVNLYNAIHAKSTVQVIDPQVATLIKNLQAKYPYVLALTSRGPGIAAATSNQLASIDVSFNRGIYQDKTFDLKVADLKKQIQLKHGILFTNGSHKGDCLGALLQRIPAKINNIVFIDDKVKNLEHVAAYATTNNLAYTGLRYGAQDHKLHAVDLNIAAIQTELLDNIISDEEAAVIAKHRQQRGSSTN